MLAVVVPSRNRSRLLADCVESLLRQDAEVPYEVLVIDDGSTDDTRQRIEALVPGAEGRLRYLRQAPSGLNAARNTGIRNTEAATIAFLDDDALAPETYVQAVVDLRRGLDLLTAHSAVDPRRVAYVGHSYGAQWGAILAAVDKRIRAAVLMGGIPERAAIYLENDDPDLVELRKSTPREQIEKYLQVNARTDAIHYVGHAAPTPLLFQFARYERYFNEAAMVRYAQAASEPKLVKWYETGHDLNDVQALLDRADWLRGKIAIKPIATILEGKLKRR